MTKSYKQLVLNVIQSGQSRQYVIRKGGRFTVGQKSDNDLTIYGQRFPKKHTLIAQKNGGFFINIRPFVDGKISLDGSTLAIKDLLLHDVLPRQGDDYLLKLTPRKQGVLTVGDAKIEFEFKQVLTKIPTSYNLNPYSWTRATFKSLTSDLLFKFIFLVVFCLNAFIIYSFKDYEVKVADKFDIERIPERLAKFIIKPPEEIIEADSRSISSLSEGAEESNNEKKQKTKKGSSRKGGRRKSRGRRGNPAATAGLLGLIGGSGSSGKSSSIIDALVDKGLVADLNSIVGGGTNLKVSKKGRKNDIDPLDQLIGTGGSGGIDDFLSTMEDDVPQVTLKKKAKVDLAGPSKKTGSSEALGRRTDESIMNVVMQRMGRITYLYEKYLKRNPNLRGKISIEFTIAANGFVIEAKIKESTVNHPDLERDILNLIKRLKFDPIPSGKVTTIFPFNFSKVN